MRSTLRSPGRSSGPTTPLCRTPNRRCRSAELERAVLSRQVERGSEVVEHLEPVFRLVRREGGREVGGEFAVLTEVGGNLDSHLPTNELEVVGEVDHVDRF